MAISFVGSASGNLLANNDTFDITLPGGLQEGDIVIVLVGAGDNDDDPTIGIVTSGYTIIADLYANDSADTNLIVGWKRMGATPDTTVTCNTISYTITSSETLGIAYCLRGVDEGTAIDVAVQTATGTDNYDANAPSITPVTSGSFIIICGACTNYNASGDSTVGTPTGFSNQVVKASAASLRASTLLVASKEWGGSGAEDPDAWDIDVGTEASSSWAAVSIALRPGAAGDSATLEIIGATTASGRKIAQVASTVTSLADLPSGGSKIALSLAPLEASAEITASGSVYVETRQGTAALSIIGSVTASGQKLGLGTSLVDAIAEITAGGYSSESQVNDLITLPNGQITQSFSASSHTHRTQSLTGATTRTFSAVSNLRN